MHADRAVSIVLAALLCGCATTNPAEMGKAELAAQYLCTDVPFSKLNECIRHQFDTNYAGWRSDSNADLINIFLAWTSAEETRVERGEVNEAEAKGRAQILQGRLDQVAVQRRTQAEMNSQAAANSMLLGLAVMAATQPQTVVAAPPVYQFAPQSQQSYPPPSPPPAFPNSAPLLPTVAPYAPPRPPAPILCSTIGNAQFATITCR